MKDFNVGDLVEYRIIEGNLFKRKFGIIYKIEEMETFIPFPYASPLNDVAFHKSSKMDYRRATHLEALVIFGGDDTRWIALNNLERIS